MNRFGKLAVGAVVAVPLVVSILLVFNMHSNPVAAAGQVGYALGTPYMAYCESSANVSPNKAAQLDFLRTHQVLVRDHPEMGTTQLAYEVKGSNRMAVWVIYLANAKDTYPCTFRVETSVNHPEDGVAMIRYVRGGSYQPTAENCTSTVPPTIGTGPHGAPLVTIRCDEL